MLLREASQEVRHLAAEILDMAAKKIDDHGLVKGDLGSEGSGFCALGALGSAFADHHSVTRSAAYADLQLLQRGFMGIDGRLSLIDLIRELAERVIAEYPEVASKLLPPRDGAELFTVSFWNDKKDRTAGDVTNALRKTALGLREIA